MASKSLDDKSLTFLALSRRLMKFLSSRNSKLIVSSFEYPLESRGSLRVSTSTFPPLGLATVISYPLSMNNLYACINSAAQKPTGQPVVVEVVGFDTTINILLFLSSIFVHHIFSRNH